MVAYEILLNILISCIKSLVLIKKILNFLIFFVYKIGVFWPILYYLNYITLSC